MISNRRTDPRPFLHHENGTHLTGPNLTRGSGLTKEVGGTESGKEKGVS